MDTLQTPRLILRGLREEDAEKVVAWRSDPEVYQYFKAPHRLTLQEHLNWFHSSYLLNDSRFDWVCLEKQSSDPIGVFGMIRSEALAEVNYLLAPDAQHKGYAKEAIQALISYAVQNWNQKKIVAEIHKKNAPSIHFIQGLGFHLQRENGEYVIYEMET